MRAERRSPKHHYVGWVAGEILAPETYAALVVGDDVDCPADVEFAPVVRRGRVGLSAEFDKHVAKRLVRAGILLIADPKAGFIELDLLALNAAKDHPAEPAVANRQRLFLPIDRGLVVPELGVRFLAVSAQYQSPNATSQ